MPHYALEHKNSPDTCRMISCTRFSSNEALNLCASFILGGTLEMSCHELIIQSKCIPVSMLSTSSSCCLLPLVSFLGSEMVLDKQPIAIEALPKQLPSGSLGSAASVCTQEVADERGTTYEWRHQKSVPSLAGSTNMKAFHSLAMPQHVLYGRPPCKHRHYRC